MFVQLDQQKIIGLIDREPCLNLNWFVNECVETCHNLIQCLAYTSKLNARALIVEVNIKKILEIKSYIPKIGKSL